MNIGPTELIIILVIVLVIFGPKRLPALARSLGGGIKEFKSSIGGSSDDDDTAEPSSGARAQAALGRPDEPVSTAATSRETDTVSDRR